MTSPDEGAEAAVVAEKVAVAETLVGIAPRRLLQPHPGEAIRVGGSRM